MIMSHFFYLFEAPGSGFWRRIQKTPESRSETMAQTKLKFHQVLQKGEISEILIAYYRIPIIFGNKLKIILNFINSRVRLVLQ